MKTILNYSMLWLLAIVLMSGCGNPANESSSEAKQSDDLTTAGQSAVSDDLSKRNVVQVAVASPDHTTLVTAVQTAGLVDVLTNVGPFTVFAPVNAAFDALPAGTVEGLLKPENKDKLSHILEYHVYVGVISKNMIRDGMVLNQVNLKNITLNRNGDEITVNGAKVLGVAEASNGLVYVIDKVLIPE
jgi:uncharacterized surface protein with fasciclin (FAS1) repeats